MPTGSSICCRKRGFMPCIPDIRSRTKPVKYVGCASQHATTGAQPSSYIAAAPTAHRQQADHQGCRPARDRSGLRMPGSRDRYRLNGIRHEIRAWNHNSLPSHLCRRHVRSHPGRRFQAGNMSKSCAKPIGSIHSASFARPQPLVPAKPHGRRHLARSFQHAWRQLHQKRLS